MRDFGISGDVRIASNQLLTEKKYWLNKLSGELTMSSFPYDYPGNEDVPGESDPVDFSITGDLFARLMVLSKRSDYTMFVILAAEITILLYKYTDRRDIVIGAPIDKQTYEGDFINTVLALRNQIDEGMTFKSMLMQVKQTIIEATEHQNYPIKSLLIDLGMEFSGNAFPLFDVVLLLENIQDKKYIQDIHAGVTFFFLRTGEGIHCHLNFDFSKYKKGTIQQIIRHFISLLKNTLFNVDIPVTEVEVLSWEEKEQLLIDFNNTKEGYTGDKTIHGLFARQVQKTPNNIVLKYKNSSLTYGELNNKSCQLAVVLRNKGVRTGDIVGIMVDRGIEMVLGMLAILKANAAYLPLDPEYPEERLSFMLKDSSVKLLLTVKGIGDKINFAREIIDIANWYEDIDENSTPGGNPGNYGSRAYVIYTSGSTGTPKGVAVSHRSIVNTLCWRKKYYQFDCSDTVLQVPSFSFDSSVEDIFTPLISSSILLIIPSFHRLDLEYLKKYIIRNRVTHFLISPNFYRTFLNEIYTSLKDIKKLTIAGDNFLENLIKDHFEKFPNVEIYNEYGPTENSVCSTVYEFKPGKTKILIGKPIDNVNCYILNNSKKLNPVGIPGELCVSGSGVADGYLNWPELTVQKFIPNPFLKHYRMYLTGDLARWLSDGNIEFLGRIDHQVKIRGYRIELGEIENRLLKISGVKEAVVLVQAEEKVSKYLCAYFVSDREYGISELREYLAKELPDFMIPSYFVQVEKIPLTPNGKIDWKALPRPELKDGKNYVAPRSEIEKKISDIWKEVLRLDNVGIFDNFFDLGGNSLQIITINNKIKKVLEKEIPMVKMFSHPTIHSLANYLRQNEINDIMPGKTIEESVHMMEETMQMLIGDEDTDE